MISAKQIVHNKYCIRWTGLWSKRIGCLLDFIGNTLILDLRMSPKKKDPSKQPTCLDWLILWECLVTEIGWDTWRVRDVQGCDMWCLWIYEEITKETVRENNENSQDKYSAWLSNRVQGKCMSLIPRKEPSPNQNTIPQQKKISLFNILLQKLLLEWVSEWLLNAKWASYIQWEYNDVCFVLDQHA